jgi:hypothetical protein
MSNRARFAQWVADTSLLICFGALPRGPRLLNAAYAASVGATPTVRAELDHIAQQGAAGPRKVAATVFTGRGRDTLVSIEFQRRDEPERETAIKHIAADTLPADGPAATDDTPKGRQAGNSPATGQHAGEAESIAVALRANLPILMTDNGGRKYAQHRGIDVESFTKALVRLNSEIPANELFRMWRTVRANHGTGPEVVTGPAYFQIPPPSPTATAT